MPSRDHAGLELDVRELEARIDSNDGQLEQDKIELASLQAKIEEQTSMLQEVGCCLKTLHRKCDQVSGELKTAIAEEELNLKRELDEASCRLQMLLQKQGRDAQFSSTEERDRWILNEVKELQAAAENKARSIAELSQNSKQQKKELKK